MKHGHALAIGLLALALSACGGNGGSDNNGTATTDDLGLTADYRVEAILTEATLDTDFRFQDPQNIGVSDRVTFQLVSYSGSGDSLSRSVVPTLAAQANGVRFSTNDVTGAAGSLSPTDGVFTASTADTGTRQFILTANYLGQSYSTFYRINPRLNYARQRGTLLDDGGNGVYNATIVFYEQRSASDPTSRQVPVARVRTASDGTFRAAVPLPLADDGVTTPAVSFTVLPPDGFASSFSFGEIPYDTGGETRPTIDGIVNGDVNSPITIQINKASS